MNSREYPELQEIIKALPQTTDPKYIDKIKALKSIEELFILMSAIRRENDDDSVSYLKGALVKKIIEETIPGIVKERFPHVSSKGYPGLYTSRKEKPFSEKEIQDEYLACLLLAQSSYNVFSLVRAHNANFDLKILFLKGAQEYLKRIAGELAKLPHYSDRIPSKDATGSNANLKRAVDELIKLSEDPKLNYKPESISKDYYDAGSPGQYNGSCYNLSEAIQKIKEQVEKIAQFAMENDDATKSSLVSTATGLLSIFSTRSTPSITTDTLRALDPHGAPTHVWQDDKLRERAKSYLISHGATPAPKPSMM